MASLLLSLAGAYGIALAAWPALRTRGRIGLAISTCVAIAILFAPLWIPAERVGLRALAAFLCAELCLKMLDYSRHCRRCERDAPPFADYARFLIPFPVLLVVFRQRGRPLPKVGPHGRIVLQVALAAVLFAAGFGLVHLASQFAVIRDCFPLDHAVKFLIFLLAVESLSRMLYGLERLAGFDTTPLLRNSFLSRTVADFWRRFNTRVHSWFQYNVFRYSGVRRAPVRGVLLCFFLSGILHELMFGIATSRFDGCQFTFFMLQAPAVLASRPLERLAMRGGLFGKVMAHGLTFVWMMVTSVFFFRGVDRVFPFFYASQPWLP